MVDLGPQPCAGECALSAAAKAGVDYLIEGVLSGARRRPRLWQLPFAVVEAVANHHHAERVVPLAGELDLAAAGRDRVHRRREIVGWLRRLAPP